ncbi:hypothetical protein A2Z00_02510 [Candidatus Gottesmanbacteria bacterium RBG_13_45_10]|uniref:Glycosyl transferase family 1 domain-containing protein n=1 Tax=Candidatus Gottesmanbacteria bacterium RBG_13_45_10 TaxID=1798370 RepID=A0A1F5ZG68_9BACT|nr:MAG: hypothetical protein A2Z00_02510 [Candidatus Gottesmanbacteria bacterium RBG_13_45_10]
MHIAIATSSLQNGHNTRGTGVYTRHLIEALQKYESKHTYTLFTDSSKIPTDTDVVHYPYFDPFFLTLPLIKRKPTVITVHDLIPIVFAHHFPRGIRGELKWQIQRLSLGGVRAIITDSASSKRDIEKYIGLSSRFIHVVYLAPSEDLHQMQRGEAAQRVKNKYTIDTNYILYIGDINWNKNMPGLIHAFAKALARLDSRCMLVLGGKSFTGQNIPEKQEIYRLIHDLGLEKRIKFLGYVPDEDLSHLYSAASVYVQPSFAEGFGLPVLEAMACGCPVIASKATSLLEIAGPSFLIDPYSINDIARAMITVMEYSREKRDQLVRQGLHWVRQFSWKRVAHETVRVYDTLVIQK